jgi:chromosome segregation ATPase
MPVDKTFENEVRITNDDRGRLDLTKQLETKDKEIQTLQQIIINLKNIIDTKEAEITTYKSVNDSHKKLNGELRQEIQNLKKKADDMLLYP